MISWITTVGWSPFAVINPIWAYCKEGSDLPTRIHLIHTNNRRIKKNLEICKNYITEILRVYSNNQFDFSAINEYEIESESMETYADNLKTIIKDEVKLKPKKIILDMTPGRKYMSAISVYYGLSDLSVPIQVFYLHLEESEYQGVPYPLTPIIKSELIDIIDSTEVFSRDSIGLSSEDDGDIQEEIEGISLDLIMNHKNDKMIKDFFILLATSKTFISSTQIRKFLYTIKVQIPNNELKQIISHFLNQGLLSTKDITNKSTEYKGYKNSEKGRKKLAEIKEKISKMEV